MRAIRIAATYLKIGVLNELQYRVNFFIQLLQAGVALASGLIGLALVFNHTDDLAGWSQPELLAVMGVHLLMGGLINAAIQPNMQTLMENIREGTLDYPLTKPVDTQLLISVREFRFWQTVDMVIGLVVLGWALSDLQQTVGWLNALGFAAALFLGGIMIYCFWLILTTSAFWIVRIDEMVNLFQGLYAAGRWPVGIYPPWLRSMLTFLIPVAFAVTVPSEAVTGRLSWMTLLGAAGLALLFFLVARWFWLIGLRNYSGASA